VRNAVNVVDAGIIVGVVIVVGALMLANSCWLRLVNF